MRLKYPYSTLNTWGYIWENSENNLIFHHFYTYTKKAIKDLKIILFWHKHDIFPNYYFMKKKHDFF